jgi:hypothetical protein
VVLMDARCTCAYAPAWMGRYLCVCVCVQGLYELGVCVCARAPGLHVCAGCGCLCLGVRVLHGYMRCVSVSGLHMLGCVCVCQGCTFWGVCARVAWVCVSCLLT